MRMWKPGQRVQLSEEGRRSKLHPADLAFRYGRLTGSTLTPTGTVGVLWEGRKTRAYYHPDFLRLVDD